MSYVAATNKLTKVLGGREIVSQADIHIKKGEIYGFLGPNGAGKTTVMKMLTNLWRPTSGTIELFGEPLKAGSTEVFKRMGSIIEFPVFYGNLSGRENLELHCEYMGYYSPGCVDNALKLLELADTGRKPVKEYSLGMKQRLGIARAVLTKPELVILDEPTNGLDPAGMKQVRELLRRLCREYGMTIMISSHILSEVESIAHTVGVLSHGRMVREISMEEVTGMQMAYIEVTTDNPRQAAYVLEDKLHLENFKVVEGNAIRIYDARATSQELAKTLALNGVGVLSIKREAESLEDYFLKLTAEGNGREAAC